MANHGLTLHIVQDLATPHNNSLIRALRERGDVHVVTWYAMRTCSQLPWKESLADKTDNYYCDNWRDRLRLLGRTLFRPRERFMVVGYASFASRAVLIVSWILHRKFIYWSDHPEDKPMSMMRSALRRAAFRMIRGCACPVFVVGRHTVETFKTWGFPASRLANLPVFIDLPSLRDRNSPEIQAVRQKYGVCDRDVLFVGASRLTRQKGYDVLLDALSLLNQAQLHRFKLLLVGSGPEQGNLEAQVDRCGLTGHVRFEQWLDPGDYERVIAAADVFVHPARFDAFGGGTLYAMALGVPVIGSDGAGAVVERVVPEANGLMYPREDPQKLADCIARLLEDRGERERMGQKARHTAEQWRPSRGAQIVWNALQGEQR